MAKSTKRQSKLNPDFKIGNMAIDLVDYTLSICNKDDSGSPRFPCRLYDSYVTEIVKSAIFIQKAVCFANAVRLDRARRMQQQEEALAEAVNLEHLILSAYNKGWISEKQHEIWQTKICNLHYCIIHWMSS